MNSYEGLKWVCLYCMQGVDEYTFWLKNFSLSENVGESLIESRRALALADVASKDTP